MQYKAIEYFTDLQDNDYEYKVGDIYPRKGYVATDQRINELAGSGNIRKRPVIEAVVAEISVAENTAEQEEEKPKKRKKG